MDCGVSVLLIALCSGPLASSSPMDLLSARCSSGMVSSGMRGLNIPVGGGEKAALSGLLNERSRPTARSSSSAGKYSFPFKSLPCVGVLGSSRLVLRRFSGVVWKRYDARFLEVDSKGVSCVFWLGVLACNVRASSLELSAPRFFGVLRFHSGPVSVEM